MAASIICVSCSARLRVPESKIGRVLPCPRCQSLFKVEQTPEGVLAIMSIIPAQPLPPLAMPPAPRPVATAMPVKPPATDDKPASVRRDEIRQTPFLIENEAVIDCPWCDKRMRVAKNRFNQELECNRCKGAFEVKVNPERKIEFKCPNCLEWMAISEQMAGRETRCSQPACDFGPIQVPASPVRIKKLDPPPAEKPEPPPVKPALPYFPPHSSSASSNLCLICGDRYVRNPTGVCYKCQ